MVKTEAYFKARLALLYDTLAHATKECPDCLKVEEGVDDKGTPFRDVYSEGCITKGDARDGTLEIYGCTTCGGNGGGLEINSSLEGNPEGVASWNERMNRVGAKYGTGRVARFQGFRQVCRGLCRGEGFYMGVTLPTGYELVKKTCGSCNGTGWQVRAGDSADGLAGLTRGKAVQAADDILNWIASGDYDWSARRNSPMPSALAIRAQELEIVCLVANLEIPPMECSCPDSYLKNYVSVPYCFEHGVEEDAKS